MIIVIYKIHFNMILEQDKSHSILGPNKINKKYSKMSIHQVISTELEVNKKLSNVAHALESKHWEWDNVLKAKNLTLIVSEMDWLLIRLEQSSFLWANFWSEYQDLILHCIPTILSHSYISNFQDNINLHLLQLIEEKNA